MKSKRKELLKRVLEHLKWYAEILEDEYGATTTATKVYKDILELKKVFGDER